MGTLIWTRAASDWERDQTLIGSKGPFILRLPCIEVETLSTEEDKNPLKSFFLSPRQTICVWTSAKTVRFFAESALLGFSLLPKSACHWAVGAATAAALKDYGFVAKIHGMTAEDLAFMLKKLSWDRLQVFLPGAKQRAFDLEKVLSDCKAPFFRLDIYTTKKGLFSPEGFPSFSQEQLLASLDGLPQPLGVAFFSPSAVQGFSAFHEAFLLKKDLRIFAAGPTTHKACLSMLQRPALEAVQPSVTALWDLAIENLLKT